MGLFDRLRRTTRRAGQDPQADLTYLRQWVADHGGAQGGVEGFIEPKTTVTEVTVVLVAADGQWTRRRVGGEAGARRWPAGSRSRSMTSRRSAIRNGCATTTPVVASSASGPPVGNSKSTDRSLDTPRSGPFDT